ncbi:MurR/RpiR family transcriptional regulator [Desemzia sp. RIT804]|uniref:MurR/RpiR family transcriptional regulator n=1 Tax=Desemzia sp. RIT 804 TaxID=2810209 RepID=UPI00194E6173|nr:MurR/RpiR family transcriptional regulator [Desemzia sp. RIT 804]MBM6614287.1 MurR/RpiR family transcriptional regulator [Desemzia sp. RIT 804]
MFNFETIKAFTETDRVLYDYLMQHKEEVHYMRVRDLAEAAHVSPASVIRLMKKGGYESFAEFKLEIRRQSKQVQQQAVFDTKEIVDEFFNRTLSKDYNTQLDKAVELIHKANLVIFLGIGTSGILAEYGSRQFVNLGQRTFFVKDPFYPLGHSSEDFTGSAAILLSVSGETEQVIEQMEVLKSQGSKIISITNTSGNTLAKHSDVNLAYHLTPEFIKGEVNITSQVPVTYLLETLARKNYAKRQKKY